MIQEQALDKVVASLKRDNYVKAIFVKGSMGRGEHDQHSDIDLYCLVEDKDKEAFLKNRLNHIKAYRELLFYDDIFIVAPQIIAIYDNMLHIDLFTVTEETFKEKDFFRVLYDPDNRLDKFKETQDLTLSAEEFRYEAYDSVWFLFQYKKSADRGNHIWSVAMLHHVVRHLARVLLHHYCPDRAQLGLKTVERSLPLGLVNKLKQAMETNTVSSHNKAARVLSSIIADEKKWILKVLEKEEEMMITPLLEKMIAIYSSESK